MTGRGLSRGKGEGAAAPRALRAEALTGKAGGEAMETSGTGGPPRTVTVPKAEAEREPRETVTPTLKTPAPSVRFCTGGRGEP